MFSMIQAIKITRIHKNQGRKGIQYKKMLTNTQLATKGFIKTKNVSHKMKKAVQNWTAP